MQSPLPPPATACAPDGLSDLAREALREGEPVITVDIGDNGSGISGEHEKMLFEPFFATKPVGEGSGVGLAGSRSIVTMYRGHPLEFLTVPKGARRRS